ncbi:SpaA isopeptide-forming pilin-related protein [Corynebacterium diphtheriae]|uniref:SpaA isopeptide-forming pilin-related protein n=1 Tax=Corynebacterium diphtheriae TaxID=1717 RepID=UPI002158E0C5|nr:hypothetical protein [Corynebacterium diphtheriae]
MIIASLVFASVRAVAVDNEGSKPGSHEVFISKVNLGGGDVVGAKLQVLEVGSDSDVKDVITREPAKWETVANEPHKVNLAAGKYKLEETFAPALLKVITPFEFEVDDRGDVTLGKVAIAGERNGEAVLEALVHGDGDDKNGITVVDGIDESRVAQDVKISKVDLRGVEVDGAELQVLEVGSDSVVKDVRTQEPAKWTTSKNEKVHKVSLLPGSYRLKESFAPHDLRPITTFEFSVNAQGVVTVKNVAVAGRNADGREVKEAVVNDEGVVVVTDGAQKSEKPKESSGWKIGNVGAVIGAGIIGILSVMVVRYLTLVLQMFTRA